jgi:hypothetical protein
MERKKKDTNPEEMKKRIADTLEMDPSLLIYEGYSDRSGRYILDLTTISPNKHKTKFLFHSVSASGEQEALEEMYDYITEHMKEQDTFQVRWHNPATRQVEVSWFRASNIIEALDKFFHDGKEIGEYKIYEVSLRPYA